MRIISIIFAIIFSLNIILADQARWITKKEAINASRFVSIGDIVYSYCAPCGDANASKKEVFSIAVKQVQVDDDYHHGNYYEFIINDMPVDLAYVYILRGFKFENLAIVNNIEVQKVPRFLSGKIINNN